MGFHWHANKTAWNNTVLMTEWLIWFNHWVQGQRVALLLDNFTPHANTVADLLHRNKLPNVQVFWLPPNATS